MFNVGNYIALAPILVPMITAAIFVSGYLLHRGLYTGPSANLADAKVNEVYHFIYKQPLKGTSERFLAKVLEVRTMEDHELRRLNTKSQYRRYDDDFERTRHLVKCRTLDGKVRSFYAERTSWVRKPWAAQFVYRHLPTIATYIL